MEGDDRLRAGLTAEIQKKTPSGAQADD